ncbi:hypothetical protein CP982_03600 [Streptomyces spectabilis]|uniref:Uncharacterized protein n=1 Tax=Streptomyces spectabilis TaxID=68270 RepID=A0A5P2WYR1_STRST|nr:hypothetical protein CP982_03600 [Streptomyces spectabilis]
MHLRHVRTLLHEIADDLVEGELLELQRARHLSDFDRDAAEELQNSDDGFRGLRRDFPRPWATASLPCGRIL